MVTEKQLVNTILGIQKTGIKLSKLAEMAHAQNHTEENISAFNVAVKELEQANKKHRLLEKEYKTKK